ncbi:hypothetical protein T439DRAFT_360982 [Meredithblackwellia eburnea MCA 4105]
MRIPSRISWPSTSVTLVTQLSISRLGRLSRTLEEWTGPVSIALYLTDPEDITVFESFLTASTHDDHPSRFFRDRIVALTIVKPDYSVSESALTERLRYPINKLRNLALSLCPSHYSVVTDADFHPSPNMHDLLVTRGVPLIRRKSTSQLASSASASTPATETGALARTAVVISAFILTSSNSATNYSFPRSTAELDSMLSSHPPLLSLTDPNAGHGPSLPSLLFASPLSRNPLLTPYPPARWSYETCYEPQWEPYYLLHNPSHPTYDERFTDQGGDKQAHAGLLNSLGFRFEVVRDVWFVHPPKGSGKGEGVEEAWPAERLVEPPGAKSLSGGEREGDEEEDERVQAHFSPAQRDQSRFRYFEDWLPELEGKFGAGFRWPSGCSVATVARGRWFGRPQTGSTIFGV